MPCHVGASSMTRASAVRPASTAACTPSSDTRFALALTALSTRSWLSMSSGSIVPSAPGADSTGVGSQTVPMTAFAPGNSAAARVRAWRDGSDPS